MDLLFPDAQVVLHRLGHRKLPRDRVRELMLAADPAERRVSVRSPAQTDFWVAMREEAQENLRRRGPPL